MTHRDPTDLAGRSRRGRALLAGGAVLGLGAVATLAAWSDDVWVASSFITTPFSIEAAVDPAGTKWLEYPESPGGKLAFQVATTGMVPGDTVYASLNLRVTTGTGANVTLKNPPSRPTENSFDQAFFDALRVTLYKIPPADCNEAGATPVKVISGFDDVGLDTQTEADLVTLPTINAPNAICFKVTLPPDVGPEIRGGSTGELIWTLHADPLE